MNATINERGELIISSESELESFALQQWSSEYFNREKESTCSLVVVIKIKDKQDVK